MEASKETVLRELISMCYDIVVEEANKTEDPMKYYIDFLREIVRTEFEVLEEEYGITMSEVKHPITALRKYRILNVKSYEYRFIDELKPVEYRENSILLKQWKCTYLNSCLKHKHPMCIRGIGMGIAINDYSDGNFRDIKVDFDMEGNCQIEVFIDYPEDLSKVPDEEMSLDDDIYRVLTRDEHLNAMIKIWVRGIERAAIKIYGKEGSVQFLKMFYKKLMDKWIEKFFKIDYYIGLPISLWTEGRYIYE